MKLAILVVAAILVCLAAQSSVDATNLLSRRRVGSKAQSMVAVKPGARKKILKNVDRYQQPSSHECYTGAVSTIVNYYAKTAHLIRGDGKKCRCAPLVAETRSSSKFAERKAAFEAKVSRNRKTESEGPAAEREGGGPTAAPPSDAEVEPDAEEEAPEGPGGDKCPAACDVDPIVVGVAADSVVAGHSEGHGAPLEVVLREFGLLKEKVSVEEGTDLHELFKEIRDQIKARKPVGIAVISGGTGHAVVAFGYSYDVNDKGKIVDGTKKLYIVDPWYSEKDPYWVAFPETRNKKGKALFKVQECAWALNKVCYTKSPLPARF